MSKLVHNDRLGYDVDITASLWRNALHRWWERMVVGEKVDLIIGVDGKPLIVPYNAALYDGEWIVNTDRVIIGMDIITNSYLELFLRKVVVDGDGIVKRYPTPEKTELRYFGYIDTNSRPVVIAVRTHRKDGGGNRHVCERIAARFEYDIEHNTQYIIDNFGNPANRQEE